jgi:hypothetical protein
MPTSTRSLATRALGALFAAAALALAVPATASAEHRDGWRGGYRYDDDDRRRHRDGVCESRHAHRGHWHAPRYARGIFHHRAAPAYLCRSCGLHFGAYDHLHSHVHHHHRVASWRVPHLISHVSFGFVFGR